MSILLGVLIMAALWSGGYYVGKAKGRLEYHEELKTRTSNVYYVDFEKGRRGK